MIRYQTAAVIFIIAYLHNNFVYLNIKFFSKCKKNCLYLTPSIYNRRQALTINDLSQAINKLYQLVLYRVHLAMSSNQTHNFDGDSNN
jgi:hypothetical protein